MAATTISLHIRPTRHRLIQNPNPFLHFFSSSSSSDDQNSTTTGDAADSSSPTPQSPPQLSSFSSYFSDVKASLKQSPPSQQRQMPRKPFSFSSNTNTKSPSKVASLEEIRKNLSEFTRRSTAGDSPKLSFEDLYKRNVLEKGGPNSVTGSTSDTAPKKSVGQVSVEAIRSSLQRMRLQTKETSQMQTEEANTKMSLLKLGPQTPDVQNREKLAVPEFFLKDEKKPATAEFNAAMKTEFVKMYSYEELGNKLRKLRPESVKRKKSWFSLEELNERLMKLREMEEKETELKIGGIYFNDLRNSLIHLQMSDADKARKNTIQRLDVLGQLGGTPRFMLSPPKEDLVEKYFHPDNMSSSEKLKIELNKVRDEFKMSESDCGSARVQVAQLTTKIKHLSTVLHKKDKHSRKGLQAMVQQRKKLLKYLRRTDWDSYCLVLSRLGLRDNPDYKF